MDSLRRREKNRESAKRYRDGLKWEREEAERMLATRQRISKSLRLATRKAMKELEKERRKDVQLRAEQGHLQQQILATSVRLEEKKRRHMEFIQEVEQLAASLPDTHKAKKFLNMLVSKQRAPLDY